MLKLLVVGITWPPETFLERLIDGVLDRNIQVTVAAGRSPGMRRAVSRHQPSWLWTPSWNVPDAQRILNACRLAHYLPAWLPGRTKTLLHIVRGIASWKEKFHVTYLHFPFGTVKPDLVYFPWVLAADPLLDWFSSEGIPVVVSLRGSMINVDPHVPGKDEKTLRALQRIFASHAAVHCVSQAILDEAVHLGLEPCKAHLIHPAVDPAFFFPLPAKEREADGFHVISVGSLLWVKGYEYALLAIRQSKDAGIPVKYVIIGDGAERSRILFTIEDLGLQDCVSLPGRLDPEQVRSRLQQADVFLLPSLSEGISNAALEAMACGLPVVTSDCGGMREAITDGVEGFVVPVRDPEAMACALQILHQDSALRAQMGSLGRKRVEKDFSLNDQIDAFVSLFNQVLPSR
jgi:colanic acid/amylovoran biosynthesis glycosyltransferase